MQVSCKSKRQTYTLWK